jgi:hypothetical protein
VIDNGRDLNVKNWRTLRETTTAMSLGRDGQDQEIVCRRAWLAARVARER